MRLTLADALHFRGMQTVDLPAALMLPLLKNPRCQMQRPAKDDLEFVLVGDLPCNIPDGAPEISLELAKGLAGALELMGVGVTLMPDQCELAHAPIGLAEIDPNLSGQPDQVLARAVEELGIGREHHVLGLNGSVEDHPLGFRRLHRSGLRNPNTARSANPINAMVIVHRRLLNAGSAGLF